MRNKSSLKQVLTLTRGHWDRPETRASVRKNFANMIDCRTPALGAEVYASETEEKLVYRMKLQNCGTNMPQILGTSIVLAYQQDFRANPTTGAVSGTIFANDKITCAGTVNTVYEVTYYVNQVQVGVPKLYCLCTIFPGTGQSCSNTDLTFDPSTATAIDPGPPPAINPFGYIYSRTIANQSSPR